MTTPKRILVGTRTSPLSLAQTDEALRPLRALYPDTEFALVPITTGGDRNKSAPLLSLGRGTFVKEIELALLSGEIDIAVHSAKDLPSELPDGLTIAAYGEREDPRDVLVDRWNLPFTELPPGARLGTSSPRRTAQLRACRSDIEFLPIRGNVGTRLDKARGGDYDGVVLAAAGLNRLGRQGEVSEYLSADACVPDVGQGALAFEARADDSRTLDMLARADHAPTSIALRCERAFLKAMGGGCKVPIAAYAQIRGSQIHVSAMAGMADGSRIVRHQQTGPVEQPEALGRLIAQAILDAGAAEFVHKGSARLE